MIDLYQTPTEVSLMCQTHLPLNGAGTKKQNVKAMECYFVWVEHGLYGRGVFNNDEEYNSWKESRQTAFDHIDELKARLSEAKKIQTWVM